MKIAIIGAGSLIFCKTLILDVMNVAWREPVEFALMAPTTNHTQHVERYVNQVIAHNGLRGFSAFVTTDRREALRGADYVICTFKIGGRDAAKADIEIPLRYGVDQCIGDTVAPGGVFKALRTIPVMLDVAEDMKALCPNAVMLNYVNPMAMVCWALGETGVQFVGLCHGVQTTLGLIAGYTGVAKDEIEYTCAGINHMGWFTQLSHNKKDLYPLLRERFERPEYYANEKVRGEVFRHFGYFMTESSGHLSEYLPYFRKNELGLRLYCDEPDFCGETGAALKWQLMLEEKYQGRDLLENEPLALPLRSVEYGSYIIEAIENNVPFRFNGNVRNYGAIRNLPHDCCAEMTMYADNSGLHQAFSGELPPQCAALNLTNINVQRLAVLAAKTGDPELAVQACALDPLTSAKLTLTEIRAMVTEMMRAQAAYLPQFEGKLPRPVPTISIPQDVKRAQVPVDPALAISVRMSRL